MAAAESAEAAAVTARLGSTDAKKSRSGATCGRVRGWWWWLWWRLWLRMVGVVELVDMKVVA